MLEEDGGREAAILTHAADLSREKGVDGLYETLRSGGRPIYVLCVNAGVGLGGAFVETDSKRELAMIDLNVRGAVQLSKLVVKDMVGNGSGNVLFTSSIAATMPNPFEAVYGGTKVFLRWFGEALREELKDTGVSVTVLMPGLTDTNFFNRASGERIGDLEEWDVDPFAHEIFPATITKRVLADGAAHGN